MSSFVDGFKFFSQNSEDHGSSDPVFVEGWKTARRFSMMGLSLQNSVDWDDFDKRLFEILNEKKPSFHVSVLHSNNEYELLKENHKNTLSLLRDCVRNRDELQIGLRMSTDRENSLSKELKSFKILSKTIGEERDTLRSDLHKAETRNKEMMNILRSLIKYIPDDQDDQDDHILVLLLDRVKEFMK